MTGRDAIFIGGALGLMVVAVVLLSLWTSWRKRSITAAAQALGFRRLARGESLPVVLVPLIDRPNRTYPLILRGTLDGHDAAFFDLYYTSGKSWDYQSTVLVRSPTVTMPKFQLRTPRWLQWRQRTCGDPLDVPGRQADLGALRLSSDDPEWSRRTFVRAPAEFFRKVAAGTWTIEGLDHSLVVYRWGTRVPARKLREYVRQAGELAGQVFDLCG
jgi:hypothetical protein